MTRVCECPLCPSSALPALPPRALFLQRLPCWHKDLPFAQMVDSRPPPPHTHVLCHDSAAPQSVSEMQLWPICPTEEKRLESLRAARDNKGRQKGIKTSDLLAAFRFYMVNLSLLFHLKTMSSQELSTTFTTAADGKDPPDPALSVNHEEIQPAEPI